MTTNKGKAGAQQKSKTRKPPLEGDVTYIRVPVPSNVAFNRDRPISDLIRAQLKHIHHAESARLPRHKRDGRQPAEIHTEAEAAAYIASVTGILHPQGRKRSRQRSKR